MNVESYEAAVYKALVDDYVRWFREFDTDGSESISVLEIEDYLKANEHNAAVPRDQLSVLSSLHHRFKEFDSNGDGVIDMHEYLHMCSRLVSEQYQQQGVRMDERKCRYHMYFYALNLDGITMYKDVLRHAARAVDIRADTMDLQLHLMCDEAAKSVVGRTPRKYDALDNMQFRKILTKLSKMMEAEGLPKNGCPTTGTAAGAKTTSLHTFAGSWSRCEP